MKNNLNTRQLQIIEYIKKNGVAGFSDIFSAFEGVSERTIKRDLSELVAAEILYTEGGGRSLVYTLPLKSRFFLPVDVVAYNEREPDVREGVLSQYQLDIWKKWPKTLFSVDEYAQFEKLTEAYNRKKELQTPDIQARELERFVIEMSWKSSRIEGNTYTLLDTELLLKEGIASKKNTEEETQMILNHKEAFTFVREQAMEKNAVFTRGYVEQVQALLMKGLITDIGLRKGGVGITGSNYRPLDNQFQIQEAFDALIIAINNCDTVFDKALTALLGISYIQPFVDGNKRTARLVANGIMLSGDAAPLSYRNIDESRYRSSLLVFYEQLSAVPMKQIFTDQYKFAVEHYS